MFSAGMNVDTFASDPSIKWYFIAAIPFMILVLAAYFLTKRLASRHRRSPHQRGLYERFFHEMARTSPMLWSRTGPRDHVVPKGRIARVKWALIRSWLRPERTIRGAHDPDDDGNILAGSGGSDGDELDTISRIKRYLSRRWTEQIQRSIVPDMEMGPMIDEEVDGFDHDGGDHSSVGDGLVEVAEILAAPAVPAAGQSVNTASKNPAKHDPTRLSVPGSAQNIKEETPAEEIQRHYRHRSRSSSSAGRTSGVMIEEEDAEWLREQGRQGMREWVWRRRSFERERREREENAGSGSRSRSRAASASAVQGQELGLGLGEG